MSNSSALLGWEILAQKKNGFFILDTMEPSINLVEKPSLINGLPDGILALIAPIVVYWTVSGIFHLIDIYNIAEHHRIHPSQEMLQRNKATRSEVLREVIMQHMIQSLVGYIAYKFDGPTLTGYEDNEIWFLQKFVLTKFGSYLNWFNLQFNIADISINFNLLHFILKYGVPFYYNYVLSFIKLFIGFFIIDTWQFVLHYTMHAHPFLYRKLHSRHHQLYVPYAYGALFNHPLEGFLLDTLGTGVAMIVTGLTPREQILLFSFATLKTVDDHCGYILPWDPLQFFFPNNSVYHDIHHQEFGLKFNYDQPFFTFWDDLFGTRFPAMITELKQKNARHITIDQYHKFLENRERDRIEKLAKLKLDMAKLEEDSGEETED